MIDVFVRMAGTPVTEGVVAESVRWSAGADPAALRHQVVTLFGDPTVTHLAWAVAAAHHGQADAVWHIAEDGSASAADDLFVATAALREDAAALLSSNSAQLRTAVAHLLSVRGQAEHSAAIRVPLQVPDAELDADAMLASLREAEGDEVGMESLDDELAA